MTLRDVSELINEVQYTINSAMGLTDGVDVKECLEDAIKPLEKAREALTEVANDIETAYLILKPNTEV